MQYSDTFFDPDPELLKLMAGALDAACEKLRFPEDINGRAMRTAMACQILMAVGAGERDAERLKLAALNATAGGGFNC